jgi:hypothetical protein
VITYATRNFSLITSYCFFNQTFVSIRQCYTLTTDSFINHVVWGFYIVGLIQFFLFSYSVKMSCCVCEAVLMSSYSFKYVSCDFVYVCVSAQFILGV